MSGYSYVEATTREGRAVYYFDQIGTGTSDKPPSSALTLSTVASVLHQVIRKMRTSTGKGGHGFSTVNVVGHSLGSYTAMYTAAKYPKDIDRLVVTGALHVPDAVGNAQQGLTTTMAPASVDPQLSATPRYAELDKGYLTTNPGVRRQAFYYPRGADATVIARDERAKDVMSATHAGAAFSVSSVQPPSANIAAQIGSSVDVLVVVGQQDGLMCDAAGLDCTSTTAVRKNECGYYRNAGSLSVVTVPKTGHSLALHRSRTSSFASINRWIESH
jgi:pimeloyl-ACP methyl ester carboxylesterase